VEGKLSGIVVPTNLRSRAAHFKGGTPEPTPGKVTHYDAISDGAADSATFSFAQRRLAIKLSGILPRLLGSLPMLIFYAWVVFLAAIIISVPVVYLIEASKNKKAQPAAAPVADELGEPEMGVDEMSEAPVDENPDDMGDFGGDLAVGEDDFSAFEEEFK